MSAQMSVPGQEAASWRFSSSIDQARTTALGQRTSLDEIIDRVAREMEVLCCHRPPCDDFPGFSRVVFTLRLPCSTFDAFFNSAHGYRGAYFVSPHQGLAANDAVIRRLAPFLLAWAGVHEPTMDLRFAAESLSSPSAKVWLAEHETHMCERCLGEWGTANDGPPELLNGRWELADSRNAYWGSKAPLLSKLRVFGAFLNDRFDEFVPARKRRRAWHINEWGWS